MSELTRALLRWQACAALLLLLAGPTPVSAQGTDAEVWGTVQDDQHAVLPGVTLTLRNQETGVTRTAVTDPGGQYRFRALGPGRYGLTAELPGFATLEVKDITVTIGLAVRHDLTLQLQALQETVTVSGESTLVDITSSEVSSVVTQRQIETLPINSRNYLSLALLMPGTTQDAGRSFFEAVNVGPSVTFNSTVHAVDGVMNNWAEDGEPRQNFPEGAVREFKVNTSQYSAAYGLATGGVVQIATKSGTNAFSGTVFEYFRDKSLNAQKMFETEKPDFRRHQFGGSFGGPIVRDRTHFFAAFERTELSEFYTVTTGRPDLYSSVEGTFKRPGFTNLYFGRIDHQFEPEQTLFVRYGQEDAVRTCGGCGGAAARSGFDQDIPRRSLVAGHTWILSSRMLNDLRFQYATAHWHLTPNGSPIWREVGEFPPERMEQIPLIYRFPSLAYGNATSSQGPESRIEFRDTFTVNLRGRHDLRVGGEYSHMPYEYDSASGFNGTYTFGSDQPFNPNDPASIAALHDPINFSATRPPYAIERPTDYWAVFAENSWRAHPNLTLNMGLRYEQLRGAMNEDLDVSSFPQPLPFVKPDERGDYNNFGPRAGFAWDVRGDGVTTLRGGYGLYYNHIRIGGHHLELFNLHQFSVNLNNPAYPDPYMGQDPATFASTAPPNITIVANNYVQPYSHQYNVGLSRRLPGGLAVHVDGLYTRSLSDRKILDLNPRDPLTGRRPMPEWGRIDESQSTSEVTYRALYVRAEKQYRQGSQFLISYTLTKSEDNLPLFRFVDQADPGADWGPSNSERRHALVASGAMLLPFDITIGAVWTYRSELPFSAVAGRDLNADGFTTDYVPGTTRNQGKRNLDLGLVNAWRAQFGLPAVPEAQIDSTLFSSIDMRLSKIFTLPRTKLEFLLQVFNVTNRVNLLELYTSGRITNALSANFGRILTANSGRQAELAVRVRF